VTFDSHVHLVTPAEIPDRKGECLTGSEVFLDELSAPLNIKQGRGVVDHVNRILRLEKVAIANCP
jgi:hypothetical protein